jgi:flagellar biosynthesis/type III secretory pathway protein FliH
MTRARSTVIVSVLTFFVAVGSVLAQPTHPPPSGREAGEPPAVPDPRISLNLKPALQEVLKQTMQEHLQALQAIVAALAQENYEKASAIAHEELGFPKHHQVMQRERGTPFPKQYQELAMAHHQAAEDLAEVIRTKEMKPILQRLDHTMKACMDCHQAYKL